MTTPPPPGVPYHRLARTERHRWWRPVLGTVGILFGLLVVLCLLTAISMTAGYLAGRPTDADGLPTWGPLAELVLALACIAATLPLVLLAVRWVQLRPAGTVSSVLGRLRWRWLLRCGLVAVPAVLLLLGGSLALLTLTGSSVDGLEPTDMDWPGWPGFLGTLIMLLLLVPLQATAEEYVFRGWLLQGIGAFLRTPWPAIGVQAVLFAAAHGWGTGWGFADLAIVATLTGWLTIRTGGLEAAIALHVVNNTIALSLAAAMGQLSISQTAADAPWEMFLVSMLVHTGYTVLVLALARRYRLDTTRPEPPAPPQPPAGAWPGAPVPGVPGSTGPLVPGGQWPPGSRGGPAGWPQPPSHEQQPPSHAQEPPFRR